LSHQMVGEIVKTMCSSLRSIWSQNNLQHNMFCSAMKNWIRS